MSFLEVNNIEKSYGKTKVLKGISFDVKKGEVLAVISSRDRERRPCCDVSIFLKGRKTERSA